MVGKKTNQQKRKAAPKKQAKKTAPKKAAPRKQQQAVRKINNNAVSITSVNEGVGFTVKPFKQQDQYLEGCDYLQTVIVPSNVSDSAVLANIRINPLSMITTSRLARFAGLYDKFRVEEMSFHYATSVSTSTDGALVMAWDADPDDDYSLVTGDLLLTELNSMDCNVNFSTYRNASLRIPKSGELWVQQEASGDQRLVNHGRLWLATEGGLAAATYGRILVKWRIRFLRPNLDPDVDGLGYAASIQASSGTFISATYPWGDFANIITNSPGSVSSTYNPAIVKLDSVVPGTATAASTIIFNYPGKYRVTLARTGAAMGVAAYTPTGMSKVAFGGSGVNAAGAPFSGQGFNAIANSASSATLGYFDVNAQAGGYVYATGDSGVTHSGSYLTVTKFPPSNIPPPPSASALELGEIDELRAMLRSIRLASVKKAPLLPSALPVPLVSNGSIATSSTTQTTQSPAGEPVRQLTTQTSGDMEIGPVDVVVLDPPPLRKPVNVSQDLYDHVLDIARDTLPDQGQMRLAMHRIFLEYDPELIANMSYKGTAKSLFDTLANDWTRPSQALDTIVSPWKRH